MRIGVLSDTHIPDRVSRLPGRVIEALRTVDIIVHLGDITCREILDQLTKLAPVEAVAGNHDSSALAGEISYKKILSFPPYRLGLIHGDHIRGTQEEVIHNAIKSFEGDEVDCILCGHSHYAIIREESGLILMNPGSPNKKESAKHASYGILQLGETIIAQLVFF